MSIMTDPQTVRAGWERYAAKVIPGDAPEIQRSETEAAFFAGALIALQALLQITLDDVSEEEGVDRLDALHREVNAFFRERFGE